MPGLPFRTRRASLRVLALPLATATAFVGCMRASSTSNSGREREGSSASAPEARRDGDALLRGAPSDPPSGPPAVQLIGRFDTRDARGPRCGWPGCRIIARFEGTRVSARLAELDEPWMQGAPSEWDVSIDGMAEPKIVTAPGDKEYVLATDLEAGMHVVELYKRTEAQNGVTQFLGYDFGDGTLLSPPPRKARRIEIIGDSSVAGFGIEGVGQGPDCPGHDFAAKWQNFHKSIGALLAATLDAELAGTVYSGKGIAKNIWHPDEETMPTLFPRALPNDPNSTWDFRSFVPDVVVVMMGGNDFAIGQPHDEGPATFEQFTNAYEAFAIALRDAYERAEIFLVASPSTSDEEPPGRRTRTNVLAGIDEVVARRKRAGDAKVHPVKPPVAQPSELTGCNGHGSPEFHRRVADDLAPILRATMRW